MAHLPQSTARRRRDRGARQRFATPIAVLGLGGLFAFALLAPIPALPNAARAEVMDRVEARLPGWSIVRTESSWEGAWSVVALCGGRQVGFQLVPGHGLPPGDAWLQPEDGYSRSRLATVSDDDRHLVWYDDADRRSLSCHRELARPGPGAGSRNPTFD